MNRANGNVYMQILQETCVQSVRLFRTKFKYTLVIQFHIHAHEESKGVAHSALCVR